MKRPTLDGPICVLAGGLGFEPRLAESESAVLPLDDPPEVGRKLNADPQRHKARAADLTRRRRGGRSAVPAPRPAAIHTT